MGITVTAYPYNNAGRKIEKEIIKTQTVKWEDERFVFFYIGGSWKKCLLLLVKTNIIRKIAKCNFDLEG